MKIQTENTAISTGVSMSTIILLNMIQKPCHVLDYGTGKLRNAKRLVSEGYKVSVLDTPLQISRINKKDKELFENIYTTNVLPTETFDCVLCSFVLNVIPNNDERITVLKNIYNLLKTNGIFLCEVRKGSGIFQNKYKIAYNDGFLIGKNEIKTFQKPYKKEEFAQLIMKSGFILIDEKSGFDSLIVTARK